MTKAKAQKHTPGPWSFDLKGCQTSLGLPMVTKANGHLVATLCDRNAANANLIAAAPDMLAALEIAYDVLQEVLRTIADNDSADMIDTACQQIDAATAKALGTS